MKLSHQSFIFCSISMRQYVVKSNFLRVGFVNPDGNETGTNHFPDSTGKLKFLNVSFLKYQKQYGNKELTGT